MKTMLLAWICFTILSADKCVNNSPRHATKASVETGPAVTVSSPIDFTKQIQPILEKRCSPCHFTGGKMYERMPFDSAQTILSHKEGILKRIKDEQENALLKTFIEQNQK